MADWTRAHHSRLLRSTLVFTVTLWSFLPLGQVLAFEEPPLPRPKVIESKALKSAEEAIEAVHVSHHHKFPSPSPKVYPGAHLISLEERAILDFTAGRGQFAAMARVPQKQKKIVFIRYTMSDPTIVKALVAARKAGVGEVHAILDLNEYLLGGFAGGEEVHSRFGEASYRNNSLGLRLKELRNGGFKYGDLRYGIHSQPLFRTKDEPDSREPLMHQKELFLVVNGDDGKPVHVYSYYGTANISESPRYNRIIKESDPDAARYGLEHAELMMATFGQRHLKGKNGIDAIPVRAPLRIVYAMGDHSLQEVAYTDGKHNWNRRISYLFQKAARSPRDLQVREVVFSHFVFTYGELVESLRSAMRVKEQPPFKVFGVFDDKFIDPHGFGMSAALAGFLVNRPMGKSIRGFRDAQVRRMKLYGYQRLVPGAVETEIEGAPISRHLWHDKSTLVRVNEDGEEWDYLFTGSFNCSNNKANAEKQVMYRLKAGSPVVRAFRESVVGTAVAETNHALKLEDAVFRNILSQFIGHSLFEISVPTLEKILASARDGKYAALERMLLAVASSETTLKKKLDPAEARDRVKAFTRFLEWHAGIPAKLRKSDFLSNADMTSVLMVLAFPKDSAEETWQQLESIFWKPMPKDKQAEFEALVDEYVEKAWKDVLKLDKALPDLRRDGVERDAA